MGCAATTTIREALERGRQSDELLAVNNAYWDKSLAAVASLEQLVEAVEHVLKNGEQGKQSRRRLQDALGDVK